MNPARCLLAVTLLCLLSACQTARHQPALPVGAVLPQNNGYFSYVQADTLTGVTMPEINRAAQAWIRAHSNEYAFEWQPPAYKAELLYTAAIPSARIPAADEEYYSKRLVRYYLTVSAGKGSYRLMLTNFELTDDQRRVGLERLVGDQALCRSVEGEATALLKTMSAYIRRNANKVTLR